jgi:hypothetical protein
VGEGRRTVMKKAPSTSKSANRRSSPSSTRSQHKAAIKAALESLAAVESPSPRAAALVELLRSWLKDDSGYDERTWPILKKALDEERDRVKARRLLDG